MMGRIFTGGFALSAVMNNFLGPSYCYLPFTSLLACLLPMLLETQKVKTLPKVHRFLSTVWFISCFHLLLITAASNFSADFKDIDQHHNLTVLVILVLVMCLHFLRWSFESKEARGEGRASTSKGIMDLFRNALLFTACYISTASPNRFFMASGAIMASLNLARVIKYRIYDDIVKYNLYSQGSMRYLTKHPGHVLFRGLFDHFTRAYLYTAFSFTIFHMLLLRIDQKAFLITNKSSSLFVDLLYYNIVTMATVGYGDIHPTSALAKLLCIGEIMISLLILGTIIMLIIWRYQNILSRKNEIVP